MLVAWDHCVTASRWCMKFLQRIQPTESWTWQLIGILLWSGTDDLWRYISNLCSHFTGIIVFLSNCLIQPMETSRSEDVRPPSGLTGTLQPFDSWYPESSCWVTEANHQRFTSILLSLLWGYSMDSWQRLIQMSSKTNLTTHHFHSRTISWLRTLSILG